LRVLGGGSPSEFLTCCGWTASSIGHGWELASIGRVRAGGAGSRWTSLDQTEPVGGKTRPRSSSSMEGWRELMASELPYGGCLHWMRRALCSSAQLTGVEGVRGVKNLGGSRAAIDGRHESAFRSPLSSELWKWPPQRQGSLLSPRPSPPLTSDSPLIPHPLARRIGKDYRDDLLELKGTPKDGTKRVVMGAVATLC
jgi:hypothetical protein